MSSYYITAHKYNQRLNIPVEEKHKYYNGFGSIDSKLYSETFNYQDYLDVTDVKIIHDTNNVSLIRGLNEDNLIGKKIFVKDVTVTLYARLVSNLFTDRIPHSDEFDMWINCRVMVVHFSEAKTAAQLVNWFRENYIYYGTVTAQNIPVQSVHQNRLRESTKDTGKFKIIKDLPFKLSRKQGVYQFSFTLSPKKDLTFDEDTNTVTNSKFKNTYFFIMGPANYSIDTDPRTYEMTNRATFTYQQPLISYGFNIKYTMYDLN